MPKVGRPEIDAFEAVMVPEGAHGRQRRFFVAFGHTRDAKQVRGVPQAHRAIIKLLTVREILVRWESSAAFNSSIVKGWTARATATHPRSPTPAPGR